MCSCMQVSFSDIDREIPGEVRMTMINVLRKAGNVDLAKREHCTIGTGYEIFDSIKRHGEFQTILGI